VHRVTFLIIKPTRYINFSILFLEWKFTCFGQFLCPSSGVLHCTHGNGLCRTGLLTACEQDQDGSCPEAVSKPIWHTPLPCVQWRTPDDGQRNCPKHVNFHSKNKIDKLMYLVGFIIRKHIHNYMYTCTFLILYLEFHVTRMDIKFSWIFRHPPRKWLNMPLPNRSNNKQPPSIILAAGCFKLLPCIVVCDTLFQTCGK